MVPQQDPSPGARLRELIHRKDRVLAVLHTLSTGLARIMSSSAPVDPYRALPGALFDHVVNTRQERIRNSQTERPGGVQSND
jgi:hypothetical protein